MLNCKQDFPILSRTINGKNLVYLDNAATSQKPRQVMDAISNYYNLHNANVHRGLHTLSEEASAMYDDARTTVAKFIGARYSSEIIFTKGTTESINRIAFEWGLVNLTEKDVILLTNFEHHSNLIPWQIVSQRVGCKLDFLEADKNGEISLSAVKAKFLEHGSAIKLVAITHASNVLGTIIPVKEITSLAHENGALVAVDGAQAIPHLPVNVQSLDCDFYSFSGHKMLGPTGIGVLYGKKNLLESLEPYEYGGGMIDEVSLTTATFAPLPEKFEAGTPNIEGAVGLSAAIDYLTRVDMKKVREHELELLTYALPKLKSIKNLTIIGPQDDPNKRTGLITFVIDNIHAHDIAAVLNEEGVAVRSGHHCVMPFHTKNKWPASTRASFYLYNTREDVDILVNSLEKALKILG